MSPSAKEVEAGDLCEFKTSLVYIVSSRAQRERKRKKGRKEGEKEGKKEGRS
jgi:predicted transposase YdaD